MTRTDVLESLAAAREWLSSEIQAARRNESNPMLLAARGPAELTATRIALQVQRQAVIQAEETMRRHSDIRAKARTIAEERSLAGHIDLPALSR